MYDPKDVRTHPESEADLSVEIVAEFDDGRRIRGRYWRNGGWFRELERGPLIGNAKMLRWHYVEAPPSN